MSYISDNFPSKGEFSRSMDSVFQARDGDGSLFDLRLVKCDELISNSVQENFTLLFRAPVDAPPIQNTYRLESESLGAMDMFLVPVAKDDNGLYFEAVFNQLKGLEAVSK